MSSHEEDTDRGCPVRVSEGGRPVRGLPNLLRSNWQVFDGEKWIDIETHRVRPRYLAIAFIALCFGLVAGFGAAAATLKRTPTYDYCNTQEQCAYVPWSWVLPPDNRAIPRNVPTPRGH